MRERGWFTRQNIQSFLHFMISEKLNAPKMQMVIGQSYETFIEGLEKPMKLNEMRNMKEPNYSKLRALLRDPECYGDPVLRALFEHADDIGLSSNSYNMVYEGFWDLYCRKPVPTDLTAKKLDGWINFINLYSYPFNQNNDNPDSEE